MIINNPKDRIQTVYSDGGDTMDDNLEGLHAAAEDILSAIGSKDSFALVSALHSFFELCDEAPHEEGEEPGYSDGGQVWDDEVPNNGPDPVTAQERQFYFRGEKYR